MAIWVRRALYIQRSRRGIYRYRRALPPALRLQAGKREIAVSLRTKDPKVAEFRYLKVHHDAEAWLGSLACPSVSHPMFGTPLGLPPASPVLAAVPDAPVTEVGISSPPASRRTITLSDALAIYFDEKRMELDTYKGRERTVRYNEKRRYIRYLIEALGADREVASLTRQDARTFRDHLRQRKLAAGSMAKAISIVAAIIQISLVECQIGIRNPFHRFHVVNDIAAVDARLPLDQDELALVRSLPVNPELNAIVRLLTLTGARLNEIAGLQWDDVVLEDAPQQGGYLQIRSNAIRRLKTASSRRMVPVLAEAHAILSTHRPDAGRRIEGAGAVFPRYGRSAGAEAASAALMKAFRHAGVTHKRKSIHSIRHSVKQALRDVGCPKDIRDAIQGHASNDIAENYGLGHSLGVMREWMDRALANLLPVRDPPKLTDSVISI